MIVVLGGLGNIRGTGHCGDRAQHHRRDFAGLLRNSHDFVCAFADYHYGA